MSYENSKYKTTEDVMALLGIEKLTEDEGFLPLFDAGWTCYPVVPRDVEQQVLELISEHNTMAEQLGMRKIEHYPIDGITVVDIDVFLSCDTNLGKFAQGFMTDPPKAGLFGKNKGLIQKLAQLQPLKDKIISLCEVYWEKA